MYTVSSGTLSPRYSGPQTRESRVSWLSRRPGWLMNWCKPHRDFTSRPASQNAFSTVCSRREDPPCSKSNNQSVRDFCLAGLSRGFERFHKQREGSRVLPTPGLRRRTATLYQRALRPAMVSQIETSLSYEKNATALNGVLDLRNGRPEQSHLRLSIHPRRTRRKAGPSHVTKTGRLWKKPL